MQNLCATRHTPNKRDCESNKQENAGPHNGKVKPNCDCSETDSRKDKEETHPRSKISIFDESDLH
ncbi:hypothetical protein BVI2075_70102 [Burkholderia vietnamiensis]|nr:hypothetical protein BVI2075_70102 [Burkholderia vietnamiensis]CAG9222311.1 hypothetical protein BVI1335_400064 [Burkholderia vietnamiensis]